MQECRVMMKMNLLKPKWSGYFTELPFAELMKLPKWWFHVTASVYGVNKYRIGLNKKHK